MPSQIHKQDCKRRLEQQGMQDIWGNGVLWIQPKIAPFINSSIWYHASLLSLYWKNATTGWMSGIRSQSMLGSFASFACCWCSLSHKLQSWVLEWATVFQSKRMIQHNWFGTRSSRTSEEGWCFLTMCEWFEDSEDGLYTLGELQQYT